MSIKVFAHRGASWQYAEHTRAAYLQALAEGADGVECDLHLSADGELVLLHDDTLDRTSSGSGAVAAHTLAQLRALDFSSWKGAELPARFGTPAEQLLTLPELLTLLHAAGRPVELAIEFKYGVRFDAALIDATLRLLHQEGWDPVTSTSGQLSISFMSFHPDAVRYLARQLPARVLCQLLELVEPETLDPADGSAAEIAPLLRRAMAEGVRLLDDGVAGLAGPGLEYLAAHPERAARWLAAGRILRVWTVDTAEDVQHCRAAGVTELTSNRPAVVRGLLGPA